MVSEVVQYTPEVMRIDDEMASVLDLLSGKSTPEKFEERVDRVEELMVERIEAGMPEPEHHTDHLFVDGVYMRTLHVPANSWIIGKRHRQETANILMSGRMLIFSHEGPLSMHAPFVFVSKKGVRKIALTLEDCSFMNVFPNRDGERDIEILESRYSEEPSFGNRLAEKKEGSK